MGERRGGRGAGPQDHELFAQKNGGRLSQATKDLGWLLERGYAEAASLKLVGDHFQLRQRQRLAVLRSAAGAEQIHQRQLRCVEDLAGCQLDVDGLNLIIALETALGGGILFWGADGCLRDLSSIHGTYRLVEQTPRGIELVGQWFARQGVAGVRWWVDAPVSNSGRLCQLLREIAQEQRWPWEAQAIYRVDQTVQATTGVAVSTDKVIVEGCRAWANVACRVIQEEIPEAWVMALPQRKENFFPDKERGEESTEAERGKAESTEAESTEAERGEAESTEAERGKWTGGSLAAGSSLEEKQSQEKQREEE